MYTKGMESIATRKAREWREANRERYNEYQRRYQRERMRAARAEVIETLGGCCAACGYAENFLALDIDHIENDGYKERSRHSGNKQGGSVTYYRRMLERDCAGLQVLCANCHAIKTRSA